MKTVLADVEMKAPAQTEQNLKAAGVSVLAVSTDPSRAEDVETLAKRTIDRFGAVHLLHNGCRYYKSNQIVIPYFFITAINI